MKRTRYAEELDLILSMISIAEAGPGKLFLCPITHIMYSGTVTTQ
ncbi:hypothetical protein HDF12_002493 [Edaphobacter lichenicola]|uniref:Uncharacterized protein n=1 Tax=Tunturiibacter lichenicola TaxID=2051959 RepID=A0A7Y9NML1_9BACT|nr:hypothetical protein [Edaphobacter lichenicola]